jgi:plastocyanin
VPRRSLLLLVPVTIVGLACGSSGGYGGMGPPNPPTADVHIVVGAMSKANQAFNPNPFSVSLSGAAAGKVIWGNNDNLSHTVTADGASPLFNSPHIAGGNTFSFTFTAQGTYTYHCSIHPTMVGTINVVP